ncbi:MAG: bifunctional 4-hydroxy-2-oxoglutarate aldolase/2-dehydro-3-deoxy-phosphogluconate aldolase [Clostridia bacterium]
MNKILEQIGAYGIVPVIKIEDPLKAVPLARAMCAGGLPLAEITFRTACAEEAIRRMNSEVPEMLVGAGTVINCEQVDRAVSAGAKFIVSPGLNEKVVHHCIELGIPITPGCSNPSDIECAIDCGLDVVKFFPAEQTGGLKYIKAIAAPYSQIKYIPTGGINIKNLNEYLAYDKILACGGSWLAPADLLAKDDFCGITAIVREAVSLVMGVTLKHIGINQPDDDSALQIASTFAALLSLPVKEGNSSVFAGGIVEVMKRPFLGQNGHIAIGVNNITRALNYLGERGIRPDMTTAKYDDAGRYKVVYLEGEMGGFAVHLVNN